MNDLMLVERVSRMVGVVSVEAKKLGDFDHELMLYMDCTWHVSGNYIHNRARYLLQLGVPWNGTLLLLRERVSYQTARSISH